MGLLEVGVAVFVLLGGLLLLLGLGGRLGTLLLVALGLTPLLLLDFLSGPLRVFLLF